MIYRFRIGDLNATILSDGPLGLPRPVEVFNGLDEATIDGALGAVGRGMTPVRIEQNCLLLETGGKRVLFDNGMGTAKLFGPHSGKLLDSLAEAGTDAASVDALVLTHAHSDHCWGTMGDGGEPNYPNATIYMAQVELEYWESNPPGEQGEPSLEGVRKHLLPLRDRIRLIRDGEEILPNVHAWLTPGHTPGHMAYLFPGGWCLSGDVAFHDPLAFAFPYVENAYDVDPVRAIATRRRFLTRLADEKLHLIGYHQPWPGLGHVERAVQSFRFVAAN